MSGGESIHPDDELHEKARYLNQARETVAFRFPNLEGEEKEAKVREVAVALENYERARTNWTISKLEEDEGR